MIAAPRRRYTRSTCYLCLHGAKHKHCKRCGAIIVFDSRLCSICEWEGPRAKTNHDLLDPLVYLLQEIFQPHEVRKRKGPRYSRRREAVLEGTGFGDPAAGSFCGE